jgi:membrane protein required for colicin V production
MTFFDILAGLTLAISALIGLARGATRELTAVAAVILAAVAAVVGARFAYPLVQHFIATAWLARVAAIVGIFAVVYVLARFVGGALSQGVRATPLSGVDRVLGLGIGLARGLVLIGLLVLVIEAAAPAQRRPGWLEQARLYPLADAAGALLRQAAPKGWKMAGDLAPAVKDAVEGPADEDRNEADGGRLQVRVVK